MRRGRAIGWRPWGLVAGLALLLTHAQATPVDDAVVLYRQHRYAEARVALEKIAAAEPHESAAAYWLGMTLHRLGGAGSLAQSRDWLAKAVKLAPKDYAYLAEYAGVTLLLADQQSSLGLAEDGRDAMTRAIAGNPDDLDAREGLMRFYATAPWPLGDGYKALDQAAEIARRDPKRGLAAYQKVGPELEKAGRHQSALSAQRSAQSLAAGPPH